MGFKFCSDSLTSESNMSSFCIPLVEELMLLPMDFAYFCFVKALTLFYFKFVLTGLSLKLESFAAIEISEFDLLISKRD